MLQPRHKQGSDNILDSNKGHFINYLESVCQREELSVKAGQGEGVSYVHLLCPPLGKTPASGTSQS